MTSALDTLASRQNMLRADSVDSNAMCVAVCCVPQMCSDVCDRAMMCIRQKSNFKQITLLTSAQHRQGTALLSVRTSRQLFSAVGSATSTGLEAAAVQITNKVHITLLSSNSTQQSRATSANQAY